MKREKTLIVNVSGAIPAVVRSIVDHKPACIVFICSNLTEDKVNGAGDVCADLHMCRHCQREFAAPLCPHCLKQMGTAQSDADKKSILRQVAALDVPYDNDAPIDGHMYTWHVVVTADVGDLQACVATVEEAYAHAPDEGKRPNVIADYTGGTKHMTLALGYKALTKYGTRSVLYSVKAQRSGTQDVVLGTEEIARQHSYLLRAEEVVLEALELANAYSYAAARRLLRDVRAASLPSDLVAKIEVLRLLCNGLDAWDRFEFAEAARELRDHPVLTADDSGRALLRAIGFLADPRSGAADPATAVRPRPGDPWPPAAIYPVCDLLNSAQRRAKQGRYDDALLRVNAAIARLAHNRLLYYHRIDPDNVPEDVVEAVKAKRRQRDNKAIPTVRQYDGRYEALGVAACYDILADGLDDTLGRDFRDHGARWKVIDVRNRSYLEHGSSPISAEVYQTAWDSAAALVRVTARPREGEALLLPQFLQLTEAMLDNAARSRGRDVAH